MRSSRPSSNTSRSRTNRRLSIRTGRRTAIWRRRSRLFEGWARERVAAVAGRDARDRPPARAHAADADRGAGRGERRRWRYRAALRPSRQAAGDGRLGRGLRAVDAADRRRQALRPRRRRRRLCDVRRADRAPGAARAGRAACALRPRHRGVRGIRQLRPAAITSTTSPPRIGQPVAGRLPRFGLRQLRPAVDDDLAARHRRRHAERRGARGGRAFGRRVGGRAVELPHPAAALVAARGRGDRRDPPGRALCPDPGRAGRAGEARRGGAGRHASTANSRSPAAPGRCRTTRPSSC